MARTLPSRRACRHPQERASRPCLCSAAAADTSASLSCRSQAEAAQEQRLLQISAVEFVTGITITNPGTGYTSAPTVSLLGGGATTAATIDAANEEFIANDTTGGLTKKRKWSPHHFRQQHLRWQHKPQRWHALARQCYGPSSHCEIEPEHGNYIEHRRLQRQHGAA